MTNIYIIRHAEAEGNIYRRIHGHYNSRITANGYRQIEALKRRFSSVDIDAVYASDLFRTCETAKAIYLPKNLPLQKEPGFREVQLGSWEDKPFGWLEQFQPQQMYNFNHDPCNWFAEGAETATEYTDRFMKTMTRLAKKHDGQTIAIFTHGCVSGNALSCIFGDDARKAGRCDNTGTSLLFYDNGKYSFEYINDNSHLTDTISTLAHQNWWRGKRDFNLWFRTPDKKDDAIFNPNYLPYNGHSIKIAVLAGQPVGYISYGICNAVVTVSCLYLIPECRHKRMGDQLLGQAVSDGRKNNCQKLIASIPSQLAEPLAFFSRLGAHIDQMDDAFTVLSMPINVPKY